MASSLPPMEVCVRAFGDGELTRGAWPESMGGPWVATPRVGEWEMKGEKRRAARELVQAMEQPGTSLCRRCVVVIMMVMVMMPPSRSLDFAELPAALRQGGNLR